MNIVASIFNLGGPDLFIILLIVLVLFGAKRLPELARGMGQAINEFNKAKDEMQHQITRADEPPVTQPQGIQERKPEAPQASIPPQQEPPKPQV